MDRKFIYGASAFFIVLFAVLWYSFYFPKPIFGVLINGSTLGFRQDLREAYKSPIYPDEDSVSKFFQNSSVKNITIAFKSASQNENPLFLVEESEIVFKSTFLY